MPAVRAGDAVALPQSACEADGHRLLSGAQVRRPVDLSAQEQGLDELLEAPDQEHLPVEVDMELDVLSGLTVRP